MISLRNPFGRVAGNVLQRCYATQVAAARQADQLNLPSDQDAQVGHLSNGVKVVTLENYSPVAKVVVVINAGCRFEQTSNLGITHCLRNAAAQATEKSTYFGNVRNLEHMGATLSATSTREHLFYTMNCLRNNLPDALPFLANITTKPSFKPWEISDGAPRLKLDLTHFRASPYLRVTEDVHAAAYRQTLGRSIYCPEYMIGKYNSKMLSDYWNMYCTVGRMALVGLGMPHAQLVHLGNNLFQPAPNKEVIGGTAKFFGGEIRTQTDSSVVYASIVTEGATLSNTKDVVALFLMQRIMGTGPAIKYGSPASLLNTALAKTATGPFAISALNANYSDSGLFGFTLAGQAEDMAKLLQAAIGSCRQLAFTEEQFKTAKKQLLTWMLMQGEDQDEVALSLGGQIMHLDKVFHYTHDKARALLESVTLNDLNSVAKRVLTGKPAMAAVGDLHNTPHLDQLI